MILVSYTKLIVGNRMSQLPFVIEGTIEKEIIHSQPQIL